jgi:trimeric autotransporter adhesin
MRGIKYALPSGYGNAALLIYDLSGKQLYSLSLKDNPSEYKLSVEGKLSAGIYLYSILVDGKFVETKRMTVLE